MISSLVIYLELFIALFFLPGFFITVILGIKKFRFLLSFALSYSLLALTLLPFEYYALPIARWQWWVLLEWMILAVLAVARTFMYGSFNLRYKCDIFVGAEPCSAMCDLRKESSHGDATPTRQNLEKNYRRPTLIRRVFTPPLIVPLVLAGVICGYLAYAGPYLEIPSDAWTHVFRFQWHKLSIINNGVFPSDLSWDSLFLHNTSNSWHFNPWYFIHGWLCNISGLAVMASLRVLTFINVLIFLLGFYFFGLFLFAGLRISTLKKTMMAAIAALFAAATMGNMVFAFVRYYAFAPAILNYVFFLAAMAVIIDWLRSNRWMGHALWMTPVFIIVTGMIHTQEALFIFFMTLALSIAESVRILRQKIFNRYGQSIRVNCTSLPEAVTTERDPPNYGLILRWRDALCRVRWTVREWKSVILTVVLLVVFFAGFAVIRHFKPGSWISPHMIMPHAGVPAESVNFIFQKLMISPPENPYLRLVVYQLFVFYQVVGCWGLFVYLLFLMMFRQFVKTPYLIAGMVIMPFLTAFNPLMVDMMVRMGQDPTVYRFHYMIPLPFVGGYLFIHFLGKAREWLWKMRLSTAESASPIWPRLSRINFIGCILVLAGLIGLIFPINGAGIYAPYSKIYTLRKIPAGNDYRLWNDFGKFMEKYKGKVILIDSLTRFMASYFPNNNCVCSTWLNSQNPEKYQPEPYTWESLRNHGLIVINRRNGAPSITGKIAKHWPEDVLKVSRYYSPEAQNYLESHPEIFRKIWDQNQIAVYAVR